MENIVEDFITKIQPVSSNDDEHKSNVVIDDLNQKVTSVVAASEGGVEGIEQYNSFMHNNVAESESAHDLDQPIIEMNIVENQNEGLAASAVISHKRKLSQDEGGVAIEKVSEKHSFPNDPEEQKKDVAKRTKLDLNIPFIEQDEGDEELNNKIEETEDHSFGLQQLEPKGLKFIEGGGRSNLSKNDVEESSSKAHQIYDFDLNVPLTYEDGEDEA